MAAFLISLGHTGEPLSSIVAPLCVYLTKKERLYGAFLF